MEDKIKHRIVGAFVLLALFTIFIPVTFKNQIPIDQKLKARRFEIPAPPQAKKITPPAFQLQPVAHVNLDTKETTAADPVDKAESVKPQSVDKGKVTHLQQPLNNSITKPVAQAIPKEIFTKKRVVTTPKAWMIQLASFSDINNAKSLEKSLLAKGYPAFIANYKNTKGIKMTRLIVGPEIKRQKAEQMQTQISQITHIKGIVVEFDPRVKTA